ncbi:MAG: ClpXP protease specificity-enhancing factor [Steroidobacteraceae bacterium]
MPEHSRRPYLLRAMHEWMIDCGYTPQVIVDATRPGVEVPRAFVKDDRIVLNLSPSATQNLTLGNEWLMFSARFSGVVHHIQLPESAVLGIYSRETGQGMVFPEDGDETSSPTDPPDTPPKDGPDGPPASPSPEPRARPQLKIVK